MSLQNTSNGAESEASSAAQDGSHPTDEKVSGKDADGMAELFGLASGLSPQELIKNFTQVVYIKNYSF